MTTPKRRTGTTGSSSSPPQQPPPVGPPGGAALLDLDQVYRLVTDCASGRASKEQVEDAVTQLLVAGSSSSSKAPPKTTTAVPPAATTATQPTRLSTHHKAPNTRHNSTTTTEPTQGIRVQYDFQNYDDDDDEDGTPQKQNATTTTTTTTINPARSTTTTQSEAVSRRSGRKRKTPPSSSDTKPTTTSRALDLSLYETIPLGRQGAKMMVVFGDGPCPDPAAVQATLLGTRRSMLVAIQDARHQRRTTQAVYQQAKSVVDKKGGGEYSTLSTADLYRVQQKDVRHSNPPCGFAMADLIPLFPQEMNAFIRWNQMKEEADPQRDDETQPQTQSQTDRQEDPVVVVGGHLQERAHAFDVRTLHMKREGYLEFSAVRHQGSFLPNQRRDAKATEWAQQQQHDKQHQKQSGARRQGVWSHMAWEEVRFLHWLGFDPTGGNSASTTEGAATETATLLPPNSETTGALAFLAHDFLGRIVEQAIAIRDDPRPSRSNSSGAAGTPKDQTTPPVPKARPTNQDDEPLPPRQLTAEDIARAMEHPHVKPIPLFPSRNPRDNQQQPKQAMVSTQLYFGPGFEDRVELELEAMTGGGTIDHHPRGSKHAKNKKPPPLEDKEVDSHQTQQQQADAQWRIREDILFEQLAAQLPPSEEELFQSALATEMSVEKPLSTLAPNSQKDNDTT